MLNMPWLKRYGALAGQLQAGLGDFGNDSGVAPEQSSVVLRSYKLPASDDAYSTREGL